MHAQYKGFAAMRHAQLVFGVAGDKAVYDMTP